MVEGTSLLRKHTGLNLYRGFESLALRQNIKPPIFRYTGFFFCHLLRNRRTCPYYMLNMPNQHLKLRIAVGNSIAMGPGKADLLDAIEACGSISAAAKKMGMSYRRAWEMVSMMNSCFDQPLVSTSLGGQQGGGAHVTAFGFTVLNQYREIIRITNQAAQAEINQITAHLKSAD